MTMTLTEFLLARIAEDEAAAREWTGERFHCFECQGMSGLGVEEFTPARVLAECEAKRRIVEMHQPVIWAPGSAATADAPKCSTCAVWDEADYDGPPEVSWPCATARLLALPYADHPEHRKEWKP